MSANEDKEIVRMQVVEIAGDPDEWEGWLSVPVHLHSGKPDGISHVELFMEPQVALDLAISLHGLLNVYMGKAVAELARKRQQLN